MTKNLEMLILPFVSNSPLSLNEMLVVTEHPLLTCVSERQNLLLIPHNCLLTLLTFWIKRSPERPEQWFVPTNAKELVLLFLCSRISFELRC